MKGKHRQFKDPLVWIPLAVAGAFAIGMWVGSLLFTPSGKWNGSEKLRTILKLVDQQYVDAVDIDSILELTYPDILAKLDPHSVYIPASELQSVNDELEGSFSGIGISFQLINDTITVVEVISGGPAEKVGLLAGDRIVAVDDSVAAGRKWSNGDVMKALRGAKGSIVKLGIRRSTSPGKTLTYNVERGDIPVKSIDAAYMLDNNTGYLKVNKFGAQTYNEFMQSAMELRLKGAKRYVVDLRGNGGGFMEPAILMANEFLPARSLIVSTKGRDISQETHTFSDGSGSFSDMGVTVLIDEYSASASEIFAGAIQDNDRGTVIGRRSFGKGLVQNQTTLPDSSAVRLTVARYYTPSGRCIQKTYTDGTVDDYNNEILERYSRGETFSIDSVKVDKSLLFKTVGGRTVYGGGGIMPDVFVPQDTTGITSWYLSAANSGLLQRFAFEFTDLNRNELAKYDSLDKLLNALPSDDELLQSFVSFAAQNKIPARWYYINISRNLIVNQLKAFIVRDILDTSDFFRVWNTDDPVIKRAMESFNH